MSNDDDDQRSTTWIGYAERSRKVFTSFHIDTLREAMAESATEVIDTADKFASLSAKITGVKFGGVILDLEKKEPSGPSDDYNDDDEIFYSSREPVRFEDEKPFVLEKPPGHFFVETLSRFFSKKLREKMLEQVVNDARIEYADALQAGDFDDAKKIRRELPFKIVGQLFVWVTELPQAWLAGVFGKAFGKGE